MLIKGRLAMSEATGIRELSVLPASLFTSEPKTALKLYIFLIKSWIIKKK